MRYLLSFVAGVFVGGVVALLYAPASGEELRAQMRAHAEEQYTRAQAEYQKYHEQLGAKLDETMAEMRSLMEQAQAEEEALEKAEALEVA
jgi:gas vesicle protein